MHADARMDKLGTPPRAVRRCDQEGKPWETAAAAAYGRRLVRPAHMATEVPAPVAGLAAWLLGLASTHTNTRTNTRTSCNTKPSMGTRIPSFRVVPT